MSKEACLRIVFYFAALFAAAMALLPHPPHLPLDWLGDKVHHMAAFGTLAVLARTGFPGASNRLILERLSFFGAMIEVAQSIPALHRDCDIMDWAADTVAVMVALALCVVVQRLLPARGLARG
jgi:hypothetical protein